MYNLRVGLGKSIHNIKLFDSIKEISIERFNRYNRALLIDSEIGSSIEDYDQHLSKLYTFLSKDMKSDALEEINNMRQQIFFIQNGINPSHYVFGVMIHSIDGVRVEIMEDEEIDNVLEVLSKDGLTQDQINTYIEHVKKKSLDN